MLWREVNGVRKGKKYIFICEYIQRCRRKISDHHLIIRKIRSLRMLNEKMGMMKERTEISRKLDKMYN